MLCMLIYYNCTPVLVLIKYFDVDINKRMIYVRDEHNLDSARKIQYVIDGYLLL